MLKMRYNLSALMILKLLSKSCTRSISITIRDNNPLLDLFLVKMNSPSTFCQKGQLQMFFVDSLNMNNSGKRVKPFSPPYTSKPFQSYEFE